MMRTNSEGKMQMRDDTGTTDSATDAARRRGRAGGVLLALGLGWLTLLGRAGPAAAQEQQGEDTVRVVDPLEVEVRRLQPATGVEGPLPFAASQLDTETVREEAGRSLVDALQGLAGVSSPDQFGSPFQQGLRIRGFTSSPVVGTSQSLSVFVDGVRVNEPDASQVNFNLIPSQAIADATLLRGPKGPFGKNTLAGALVLQTKRGRGDPSATVDVSGAYFSVPSEVEELNVRGEFGGEVGPVDFYGAGKYLRTQGWRMINGAELMHGFLKLGHRYEDGDVWVSYTVASDSIEAPGSLPRSWLQGGPLPAELADFDGDRRRIQFTGGAGDFFVPTLHFVNGLWTQRLADDWQLSLNGFGRFGSYEQFNDNVTEENSLGETDIASVGTTAQVTFRPSPAVTVVGGAEYARHDVDILIRSLPGRFSPDAPVEVTEDVGTEEDDVGVFLSSRWSPTGRLSLSGSVRWDWIRLPFTDNLDPSGSGTNIFRQVTGSLGTNYQLTDAVSLFGSYGRGFRAPFILEITCSDPDDPCPLPFELGADPPIDPVQTDTWQAGARFVTEAGLSGELAAYWAEVYDDIHFVTDAEAVRGFFQNVPKTRRQGLEATVEWEATGALTLDGALAYTRATFQSEARLATGLLDLEEEGEEEEEEEEPADGEEAEPALVEPGDEFSVVPEITFTLGAEFEKDGWKAGLSGDFVGEQWFAGDENNTGALGKLDSYFLLDARVSRVVGPVELYAEGRNILDSRYEPFGLLARNVRGPDVGSVDAFLTPGEPLRVFAGVRATIR